MSSFIFIKNIVSIYSSIALKIAVIKSGFRPFTFNADSSTSGCCIIVYEPAISGFESTFIIINIYGSTPTITSSKVLKSFIAFKYTIVQVQFPFINFNGTTLECSSISKGNVIDCDLCIVISYRKEPLIIFTTVKNNCMIWAIGLDCYRYTLTNFNFYIIRIGTVCTSPNPYFSSAIITSFINGIIQILIPSSSFFIIKRI